MRANAYVAAALAAMVASPAFARSPRKVQRGPAAASFEAGQRADPDPNVLFELMQQQQWV